MSHEVVSTRGQPITKDWIRPLLSGQLSQNTIRAYRHDLSEFFGLKDLQELAPEAVRAVGLREVIRYRNRLMTSCRPSTVGRKLSAIRAAFDYFVDMGIVSRNPAKSKLVRSPKVSQESFTQGLTKEEAERLLQQPDRAKLGGRRDYAILLLMLHNGLRRSEILKLRVGDLKNEGYYLVLDVLGKGGKRRRAKIKPLVKETIDDYLQARKIDPEAPEVANLPLFTTHANGHVPWEKERGDGMTGEALRQMVLRYVGRAGIIKRIHPHSLRHTFTTLAIEGGARIDQVQAALGHSDPKTTMRYFRAYENLEDNATDYVRLAS